MAEYSIREVLEMAVQTEKVGSAFYGEMAGKFRDDKDLSELFARLAEREKVHEAVFEGLKEGVRDERPEGWEQVSEYLRAVVESAFFIGRDKATTHMQNIDNYQAALGFALAFEKETLLFFYGMRDAVAEKDRLDEVIEEEKSHISWLSNLKKR